MDLFQEMALSQGTYFNHLYMNVQPEDAAFIYKHKTNHCHGLVVPLDHHHYLQLAEGMDETNLALQTGATANATSTSINPSSLHESLSTNSLGFVSTSKQQPCEMSNAMSTCEHGNIKRRSWQETLCSAPLTCPRTDISAISIRHANSNTNQAKVPNVENILTLHHIQAAANTDPNYLQPSSLTTMELPLEESLIAMDDDQNHVHAPDLRGRSFVSALNHGDEAFFKQQLLVPMEDLITDYSRAISDHEEVYYSHCHHQDPVSCFMLPHGIANHEHEVLPPDELRCGYFWGHQESSAVTDLSTRPPCNMDSHNTVLNSSGHVNTNNRSGQSDNDEKLKSASEDSNQSCIAHQKAGLASRWVGKMINGSTRAEHDLHLKLGASGDGMNKLFQSTRTTDQVKKRSLSDEHDDTLYVSHSKRTHLGPHVTDTNIGSMTKHSSSATSFLTMISGNHSAAINATTNHHQPAKTGGKSSLRHPLGPALNTNLKPRARQGAANDPQTLAARNRRERINARLKTLQELVPNGSKVDLVTMLEKAINYVKFLQLQLRVLSNDELWQANQMQKVSMQKQEEEGDESKTTYNRTTSNKTA